MYKINIKPILCILFLCVAIFSAEFSITKYALTIPSIFIFLIFMLYCKKDFWICKIPRDLTVKTILIFLIWCIVNFIINYLFNGANLLASIISIIFTYMLSTVFCFFIGLYFVKLKYPRNKVLKYYNVVSKEILKQSIVIMHYTRLKPWKYKSATYGYMWYNFIFGYVAILI